MSIFVTFDPNDTAASIKLIRNLEARFPGRTFRGRHLAKTNQAAKDAIAKTTLTLVLESESTATSPEVKHDIEASLAKDPRNEILCIVLPSEKTMIASCEVAQILTDAGTERIQEESGIEDAFERLESVRRLESKIQKAIGQSTPAVGTCGRT